MAREELLVTGEALLQRLQRLVTRVRAAREDDRRQLFALLDDVETIRGGLLRESAEIEDELRRASARAAAIGAYLRGSQVGRGRRHS